MNINYRQSLISRPPHHPFETVAAGTLSARVNFWEAEPTPLEKLTARLLARALRKFSEPHFNQPLRRAAREAAALAQDTSYPLLVFPELFSELAIAAMLQTECRRLGRFCVSESNFAQTDHTNHLGCPVADHCHGSLRRLVGRPAVTPSSLTQATWPKKSS